MKYKIRVGLAAVMVCVLLIFAWAPQLIDKSGNVVVEHLPFAISERASLLHKSLVVGDWHADSLLWARALDEPHDYGHVDISRLQQGNVGLQMFTAVTKSPRGLNLDKNTADTADNITALAILQRWPVSSWNSLTARALYQADKLHLTADANPHDLVIIKSQQSLVGWQAGRRLNADLIGGLLGIEGLHALDGKFENLQVLFDSGYRMMGLQHFFDNELGGSLHGLSQAGLTEFGYDIVKRMNELGIIIDVAHSSEQVVRDVLGVSSKPLVVSHTGFKGHCDTARNIADSLMQKIAQAGGLVAVGYWDKAICGTDPQQVVAAIKYGIDLIGEDHLSLGSDFDGSVSTGFDTAELVALTQAMLDAGFSEPQIRKIMGGNMLRFLQQNLPNEI